MRGLRGRRGKVMNWVRVEIETPINYQAGNWDGRRSDLVLVLLKDRTIKIGRTYYTGSFMDVSHSIDWYDDQDFEFDSEVVAWMELPDTLIG